MSIAPEDLAKQRFKPVAKVFEKITRLGAELAETRAQVEQLKNEQAAAAHRDRLAYAAALSEGKGKPSSCEEATVSAELEDAELKAEALTLALDAAFDDRARLIEQNRSGWRRQSMRELARARSRYESAIAELEAARDALSGEATLITWLDSGASADAASDPLGGRIGTDAHGREPLSFVRTLEALRGDAAYLAEFPVARDDPAPEPKLELAWRGGEPRAS
jgi:hypothetical protein